MVPIRGWLVAVVALICVSGAAPARAAQVDFSCTLPLFHADSLNCQIATTDTLKDLATVAVYSSSSAALTDSVLVLSANVPGQEGKAFNFSAQQATWTTRWYWNITRDVGGHRACKSNVVMRTVTAGPPMRVTDLRAR